MHLQHLIFQPRVNYKRVALKKCEFDQKGKEEKYRVADAKSFTIEESFFLSKLKYLLTWLLHAEVDYIMLYDII